MPKASEVAASLRILADSLDREPDTDIEPLAIQSPHINSSDKESFLSLARLMPRPFEKEWGSTDLKIVWGKPWKSPVYFSASILRSTICEIVEPAKPAVYRCDPLLSEEEVAELGDAA